MSTDPLLKEKSHWSSIVALTAGIASVFLWEFSLVPILAIVFGVVGLLRDRKKWMSGAGLALGIVFLVLRFSHGYMDRGLSLVPSGPAATTTTIQIESLQQKVDRIYVAGKTVDQAISDGEISSSDRAAAQAMYQAKLDYACEQLKEQIKLHGPSHMPVMDGCQT